MSNYIIDKSFQMLRTNTKLTTNIKINIDSGLQIYLESINTNKQLSDDKYKHYLITKDSYIEDKIPLFYDGLPSNIAYDVKDINDKEIVYNTYDKQYDDLYWSGVKKVEENNFYKEEFEYFAPLYIKYNDIPDFFIIMRVDEPVIYELSSNDYKIGRTIRENFREEIINKWKCVTTYDLSIKTDLGYWINKNFITNERFPINSFEFDSNETSFTRWYGIDYMSGGYTEKSQLIKDKIWYEQPHFNLEEYITDGFHRNNLIYPNILNFNYLFDDNPATPYQYNKYSINRYYGFYVDLTKVVSLTSYKQQEILSNVDIKNNIFITSGSTTGSTSPFFMTDEEWDDENKYYIYVKDTISEVIRTKIDTYYQYSIISEYDVKISDITREYEIDIEFEEKSNTYKNKIKSRYNSLNIDILVTDDSIEELYGDLYLIEIDNKYHVLELDGNEYNIRSDYGIQSNSETLEYWIGDIKESIKKPIEDKLNKSKPLLYNVYRVKFRDIKDFDYDRVDTGFADFDFDQEDKYVETDEHKLYCEEHMDASESTVFKKYDYNDNNANKIIIASSEYVSDDELYEITKDGLTGIWDKNQSIVKWGYSGSISHSDYPYKLNNSNKVGFIHNRTTDIISVHPNITTKTNDYFYGLGTYISAHTNGLDYDYKYFKTQSLSIETDSYGSGENIEFDLDLYLKSDFDYFEYFFNHTRYVNDNKEYVQTQHYSVFNSGSKYNSSTTLFKGIKYSISNVIDVIKNNNGDIEKYIISNKNYNQYKFSVINNYTTSGFTGYTYDDMTGKIREYKNKVKYSGDLGQNNINIIVNDKFKNVLIIINSLSVVSATTISMNNIDIYSHNIKYQNTESISTDTASLYINRINSNLNRYFYVDENGKSGVTINTNDNIINGNMRNITGYDFSPVKINILKNNLITIKKNSYNVSALKGPKTNIYGSFKTNFNESVYDESFIKEPLARIITINEEEIQPRAQVHGERLIYDKKIYRYNGPYEPIFKNIELFESSNYYISDFNNLFQKSCEGTHINTNTGHSYYLFNTYSDCENIYMETSIITNSARTESSILTISDLNFNIPGSANITGISVEIKHRAAVGPGSKNSGIINTYYSAIADKRLEFVYDDIVISENKAISGITQNTSANTYYNGYWLSGVTETITYGSDNDMWLITGLTTNMINDEKFGIRFQIDSFKFVADMINIAYIYCICVKIHYQLTTTSMNYSTYLERNIKFDEKLKKFGEIDAILYSKVNENENMLKLKNTKEDRSYYPMIDEIGYSYNKKFIFNSSWDTDYYIRTKNEIE